jgi:hypothetical protein
MVVLAVFAGPAQRKVRPTPRYVRQRPSNPHEPATTTGADEGVQDEADAAVFEPASREARSAHEVW